MAEERVMFFAPENVEIGITPNQNLSFLIGKPHPQLGFAPDLTFAMELTPDEARGIADLLVRKAREAEGGTAQH
jgi:hypothetical protein